MKPIAHARFTASGEPVRHLLEDHLRKVSGLAGKFAGKFGATDWAETAGLWHDLGKYRPAFQAYIERGTGINPDAHIERISDPRTNHASTGALHAIERFGLLGLPLAYCIAGHHAGLPDYYGGEAGMGVALKDLKLRDGALLAEALEMPIPTDIVQSRKPASQPTTVHENWHLAIRMLFSCLVDADFLDTESFLSPDRSAARSTSHCLSELHNSFNEYMSILVAGAKDTQVNRARAELLAQCREKAADSRGIYTLTVPTGGGKTLSSLAFALDHAVKHSGSRIIYAIPYTSIIDQTAAEFRKVFADFGDDIVIEHHSNMEPAKPSDEKAQSRLATENWDAPVIVTTTVQLFESLFAARTSRARKLHNLVGSVIVIDEVQLLPARLLEPIYHVINALKQEYAVTFLLSTATPTGSAEIQNAFGKRLIRELKTTEIIDDPRHYYLALSRVKYHLPNDLNEKQSWDSIADQLLAHETVLAVVNTRRDARRLFELMPKGAYHLSAQMCPAHRKHVIAEIKQRLADQQPTRVISTQLIEAGVDLDFPVVFRALAGLDSIVQTAGRCNREGRLRRGDVFVFVPPSDPPPGDIKTATSATKSILAENTVADDLDHPATLERYFTFLYRQLDTGPGHEVLNQLTPGNDTLNIEFRTAAKRFKMIEDDSYTIYIPYDEKARQAIAALAVGPTRQLLRQLQLYAVTVYERHFFTLLNDEAIEEIYGGYYCLSSSGSYDANGGLIVGRQELPPEEAVI